MLDHFHLPTPNGNAEVFYYLGNAESANDFVTWTKPRGKTMIDILMVGCGGNGGNGAIGAASTAAGGGGGGSGAQTRVTMPLTMLPDTIYLNLRRGGNGVASYVTIAPDITVNNRVAMAGGGSFGGNASGATAGAAGGGGGSGAGTNMPIGWAFAQAVAGQAGIISGTTGAGGALTLPTTGLLVTGGTGGGGLGAAASTGAAGGSFTVAGVFPSHAGGAASGSQTVAPGSGAHGYRPISGLIYGYGGTGGASTGGAATGGGLVQSSGGDGAPGCGGGGSGGALTGSTAGTGGKGGPAFCIITCW